MQKPCQMTGCPWHRYCKCYNHASQESCQHTLSYMCSRVGAQHTCRTMCGYQKGHGKQALCQMGTLVRGKSCTCANLLVFGKSGLIRVTHLIPSVSFMRWVSCLKRVPLYGLGTICATFSWGSVLSGSGMRMCYGVE